MLQARDKAAPVPQGGNLLLHVRGGTASSPATTRDGMDLRSAIEPGSGLFRLLSGFLLPVPLAQNTLDQANAPLYIEA